VAEFIKAKLLLGIPLSRINHINPDTGLRGHAKDFLD
jgi:hypothetical protein